MDMKCWFKYTFVWLTPFLFPHPIWLVWTRTTVGEAVGRHRTLVSCRAVECRLAAGFVHHGYHGNTEVDAETIDDGEAEEHHDGEVEAGGAALRMYCGSTR